MPWTRRGRHRRRRIIRCLLLATLGMTFIPLAWLWHYSAAHTNLVNPSNTRDKAREAWSGFDAPSDLDPELTRPERPVYPYSVIPGGVQSVREFREALLRDPVAAVHYARFDISRSRVIELQAEKIAYVSYRIRDRIFWTTRKVRLLRGERIITDGVHSARARCGNRISEVPQPGRSPHEPLPEELENPLIFANRTVALTSGPLGAELIPPAAGTPPAAETTWFVPPPFGFIAGASAPPLPKGGASAAPPSGFVTRVSSPPVPRHHPGCPYPLPYPGAPCKPPQRPPSVVPEPGTLLLISTGAGVMLLRGKQQSRGRGSKQQAVSSKQ